MQNTNGPSFSECNEPTNEGKNPIDLAPPDFMLSQSTHSQIDQYPPGYNNLQLNQPQSQYPIGINSQFHQSQGQYPVLYCGPQFNQLPPGQNPIFSQINPTIQGYTLLNVSQAEQILNRNVTNQRPPNYKFLALFSCMFCFWPAGLCALHNAYKVDLAFAEGKYLQSQAASNNAKRYSLISILVGLMLIGVFAVFKFFLKI